ncbi:hypothetical protein [Pseudomonas sp. GD03944]|uniref:hypothetical protein n=1 Tax=Pseudomonas sp. GD03944 TaxID=2975409 RepID=UPI002447A357|nr:hypothetical protein [Pseudomonas sp. GD03944]MDH1261832.1 hypothetical protein [Pseudomonas sp. GD03944]
MNLFSPIQLWTPGDNFVAPEVVFHSDDHNQLKRLYRRATQKKASIQHCRFYKILPNGKNYENLIQAYILHKNEHSIQWINSTASALRHWKINLELVNDLCRAFNELNHETYTNLAGKIDKETILPETGTAIDLLNEICNEIIYILCDKTPYCFTKFDHNHKAWWLYQTSIKSKIKDTLARINKTYQKKPPERLTPLVAWLTELEKQFDKFLANEAMNWPRQDAIKHASAYCWALCERQISSGNPSLALLMAHRSIDLLLLSECISNNLISFAKDKSGSYTTSTEKISISESLRVLNNYLSPNAKRDELFTKINSWRNQLLYTHYFTGTEESHTLQMLLTARLHMESIGGRAWKRTQEFFLSPPTILPFNLLNVENNLDKMYEEIELS